MIKEVYSDIYLVIFLFNFNFFFCVVFIIGVFCGIGLEIVVLYVCVGVFFVVFGVRFGFDVIVKVVIDVVKEVGWLELVVFLVQVDIFNVKSIEVVVGLVKEKFGRLDVIVNNVGVLKDMGYCFVELDFEEWFSNYEINVKGLYLVF